MPYYRTRYAMKRKQKEKQQRSVNAGVERDPIGDGVGSVVYLSKKSAPEVLQNMFVRAELDGEVISVNTEDSVNTLIERSKKKRARVRSPGFNETDKLLVGALVPLVGPGGGSPGTGTAHSVMRETRAAVLMTGTETIVPPSRGPEHGPVVGQSLSTFSLREPPHITPAAVVEPETDPLGPQLLGPEQGPVVGPAVSTSWRKETANYLLFCSNYVRVASRAEGGVGSRAELHYKSILFFLRILIIFLVTYMLMTTYELVDLLLRTGVGTRIHVWYVVKGYPPASNSGTLT
jgi:hypothetical protein